MNIQEIAHRHAINILIIAAGKVSMQHGERDYPLCLSVIGEITVLERLVSNTKSILDSHFTFTFLESEAQRFHLEKIVSLLVPSARCIRVPEQTKGSACTALLAACQLDQQAELLIVSANELVDLDLGEVVLNFRDRGLDAGTLIFCSVHPRYSYVALGDDGLVTETAQREPISTNATAGVFWFAKTSDFVDGAQNLIRKDAHVDGSYFVAPTFNELVLRQKKIGVASLPLEKYIPLKTEQQIVRHEGVLNR